MQNKSFKTAPNAFEPEAFFVLLILFILAPFALANKEQSSKLADFEGHTYEKIDTPMTWQEASSFAKEKHGTLVKVDSFQENKFLRLLMSAASTAAEDGGGSVYFWLGGTDLPSEGTWRWHDGSMIKPSEITAYPLWGEGPGFNLGSSEPDNFMGNQNCLAMGVESWPQGADSSSYYGKPGQWNDLSCSNKLEFLIEYDTSASFKNGTLKVNHLTADDKQYSASFSITECLSICLQLTTAKEIALPHTDSSNSFKSDLLRINKLSYANRVYRVDLKLIDSENLIFEATNSSLTPSIINYPSPSWITARPEEVGMNSNKLQKASDYAFNRVLIDGESLQQNTQGLVIIRHGAVVFEKYAAGSTKESKATSWSTAKSFTSALTGITLDRGYISSIDISAAEFIEEWKNTEAQNITIKNLLMMSSGLTEKGGDDGRVMYSGALKEDGSIDYSKPVNNSLFSIQDREVDGSRAHWRGASYNWNYQNADTQVVGEIIERATGKTLYEFADAELFSKIGMTASWWKDAFNNYMPWCCIDATTRDFARFGLLYAREGRWGSERVMPAEWVTESTALTTTITSSLPYGYGYFWWPDVSGEWFMAVGSRSNNIYIHPGLDLVVVRNSTLEVVGDTTERSRSYHLTKFPAKWDHNEFFQIIIDSINP